MQAKVKLEDVEIGTDQEAGKGDTEVRAMIEDKREEETKGREERCT